MNLFFCLSAALLALAGLVSSDNEKVIVCYVGTWATYRQGLGKFDVENIEPSLCTHLIYTFVGLARDGSGAVISLDSWLDFNSNEGGGRDNFRKFNDLKTRNPNLKTLLAVGGDSEGSAKYSQMAADATRRQTFISSALAMVQKYGFDGLDLDWEYPNQRDSVNGAADIDNLTTLLKELKYEFGKYGLLVTIAVAAVEKSASLSYNVIGVSSNVDFVHLMAYDLHGSWDSTTGHNAGLYKSKSELDLVEASELTVDAAVKYWLNQGCPPQKLVLGMPFYGRSFTLTDANVNGVGAPSNGNGIAGPYTGTAGLISYNELCTNLQRQNWQVFKDDLAKVPYAVQNKNWVSYDCPNSLAEKVDYALKYNLAGVMVWSLESDDFNAICQSENFPLLRSINRALNMLLHLLLASSVTKATNAESSASTTTTTESSSTKTTLSSTASTATEAVSSTTTQSSTNSLSNFCKVEGRIPNPTDCTSFYCCVRYIHGTLDAILLKCPSSLYWDSVFDTCNYSF